jgi:hypothetical protein
VIDPVTKIATWKIEPGDSAQMTIDLTPPSPPKPVAPSKGAPGKNDAGKVDSSKAGASTPAANGSKNGAGTSSGSGESKTGNGGGSFYAPPATKAIPASPAGAKVESLKPAVEVEAASKKNRDR